MVHVGESSSHPLAPFIPPHPIAHPPPISFLHHPYHSAAYALSGCGVPKGVTRWLGSGSIAEEVEGGSNGGRHAEGEERRSLEQRLIAIINPSVLLNPSGSGGGASQITITPARGQRLFYSEVVRQIRLQVEEVESVVQHDLIVGKSGAEARNGKGKGKGRDQGNPVSESVSTDTTAPNKPITKLDTFIRTLGDLQARHNIALSALSAQADPNDPDPTSSNSNANPQTHGTDITGKTRSESEQPDIILIILDAHALPALVGPSGVGAILSLPEIGTIFPSFPSSTSALAPSGQAGGSTNPASASVQPTLGLSLILTSPRSWSDDLGLAFMGAGGGASVQDPVMFFLNGIGREEFISSLLPLPHLTHPLLPHFIHHLLASSLTMIPYDVLPTIKRLARPLWKVYTSALVEHAEDWMLKVALGSDEVENEDERGEALDMDGREAFEEEDRGLTSGQRRRKRQPGQDVKPLLRVTNPLLLELNARSRHAFQAANESLLPGLISESKFLSVFLPSGAVGGEKDKDGHAKREIDKLGLQGEERERARAFFEMMPSNGGVNGSAVNGTGEPSTMTLNGAPKQRKIVTRHHDYLVPIRPSNPFSTSGPLATNGKPSMPKPAIPKLPLFARYLLLAAYCASYNSPRSDLRIFGRGPVGSLKRKVDQTGQVSYEAAAAGGSKKKGGGTRKVRLGRTGKVPQSLLGPKAFGLDRMLAIFMALLVEHGWEDAMASREDADEDFDSEEDELDGRGQRMAGLIFDDEEAVLTAKRRDRMRRREERRKADWEDEVEEISRSVGLFGLIPELEKMRFLRRVSPRDRLDNIQIRCEAPKEMVVEYARTLKVDLAVYLVDGE